MKTYSIVDSDSYIWKYMLPRKAYFLAVIFLLSATLTAQDNGLLLNVNGAKAHFSLPLSLTDDFSTLSFWIQPTAQWNSSSTGLNPIVVKDKYGSNVQWGGRYAIYMEDGKIKWQMSDYQNPAGSIIESDSDTWYEGVWYHMAFVIHPSQGMRMYINGILQQDTDSRNILPPGPQEGPDEPFYVGCWGNSETGTIEAMIDELRFWSVPRSQVEIRSKMCEKSTCWNNLLGAYDFDLYTSSGFGDVCFAYSIINLSGVTTNHVVPSTVPVGDFSSHIYASDWTGQSLLFDTGRDTVVVSNITLPSNEGLHIYFKGGEPKNQQGLTDTIVAVDGVIAVWCTDTTAVWDMRIDFGRALMHDGDCSYLYSRDIPATKWNMRPEFPAGAGFDLIDQSDNGRGWREEYFVVDEISFNPSLPDSSWICSNQGATLRAYVMTGATYEWNTGQTGSMIPLQNGGLYWVKMQWGRCVKYDTTFVSLNPIPEFEWVTDTTICEGDLIELTCPLDSGVTYYWDTGDSTQSITTGRAGVYFLFVNNGYCTFENYVTVRVIPEVSVNLGEDTLMCLGQSLSWRFNPNVGSYLWWDGSQASSRRIFNQPGTYWVQLSNSCFTVSDTIHIEFEDCDCRIDIPNTFTPNSDWVNDETGVFTRCYFREYRFIIMDRWGNRVFDTNDPQEYWDGTMNGEQAPEGVYVYRLSYERWTGPDEPVIKTGMMTLIR